MAATVDVADGSFSGIEIPRGFACLDLVGEHGDAHYVRVTGLIGVRLAVHQYFCLLAPNYIGVALELYALTVLSVVGVVEVVERHVCGEGIGCRVFFERELERGPCMLTSE